MNRVPDFWHVLGELEGQPEVEVIWDDALYDEPETGQYWAYVQFRGRATAHLSNSHHVAFVLPDTPLVIMSVLYRCQVRVVTVPDLQRKTLNLSPFLQRALRRRPHWTPEDLQQFVDGIERLGLRREWEEGEYVITLANADGVVVAVEHVFLPLALTLPASPPGLTPLLHKFGHELVAVEEWSTPLLSLSPETSAELTERLPLSGFVEGELAAFSLEQFVYWLR
ncbi:hypothetical protein F8S09_04780 [Deinococcus sp. SDU3-2]|uniref:Uncharacterized protein n=1 Tax=Deinococcus terrestris TaxID=2651870 RepID=A0A7X1TR69_9DEIO|nr:hypothetical protein [Deinococcus terrestris]MPY66012.1 hypothetical protein [Deinococcus terrestris]